MPILITIFLLITQLSFNSILAYQQNDNSIATTKHFDINNGFADLVDLVNPTVVNISTTKHNKILDSNINHKGGKSPFPFDKFGDLDDLFEQFAFPFNFDDRTYNNPKSISLGSGFIIDENGYILTNHHVISKADEITVKLSDDSEYIAKLIGSDAKTDLALLKIEAKKKLPYVNLGDSAKVRAGDWVFAVGNPFGLGGSVTAGIVSSKSRDIDIDSSSIVNDFIQIDASINMGNSGGPTFNTKGEVIGVNTAIYSTSGGSVGIGFAIPVNTAKYVIEELKNNGKISRGLLNIRIQEITKDLAEALGVKANSGVLVADVEKNGAGDKAGLKTGDIITSFNGVATPSARKLQILVASCPVNTKATIDVIRAGAKLTLSTKIDDVTIDSAQGGKENNNKSNDGKSILESYGIIARDSDDGILVTEVDKSSPWRFIMKGDFIKSINQKSVINCNELNALLNDAVKSKKSHVALFVHRNGQKLFLALPLNNAQTAK